MCGNNNNNNNSTTVLLQIMHYCLYCSKNSIILTKHDYSHDRVGTCSSSTDPSRRPREPSKASSWNLRYVQPPRSVRKPPRRVRGGALEAPRSLLEDTLREGFAKAPRAPSFGNDSSDNDKPPYIYTHAVTFVAIILFLLDVHVRVLPLV